MSAYMALVKASPCVCCKLRLGVINTHQIEVHHAGRATDRDDYLTVALCYEHHRGATGVHGMSRKGFERFWKLTDLEMLACQVEHLHKEGLLRV